GVYQVLFNNSLDGIVLADAETGAVLDCNPAFERLSGWKRKDLLGKNHRFLHPQDNLEQDFCQLFKKRSPKKPQTFMSRVLTRNGEIVRVEVQGSVLQINGRRLVYGIFRDVSEREKADAKLRESEARLQTVLENIPLDFWVCDETGKYVLQNRISYQNWGIQIGRRPEDMNLPLSTLETWKENNRRALDGEVVRGEETYIIQGKRRVMENVLAPIYIGGQVSGFLGINIDITDRVRAEEERNLLFNNSIDLQAVMDSRGCFKQLNLAWEKVLGWPLSDLLGRSYVELVHPDDLQLTRAAETSLVTNKTLAGFENRLRTKSGAYKWLSWNASQLSDDADTVFAVIRDITEQKRLQQAINTIETRLATKFGENFLDSLVLEISETLGSDYTFIGRLSDDGNRIS
ncbi:MAG TPA: PAS domain S-box protein, partial [Pseudomonadales bacterium]|nr:PAS domain S-box protein [Pseudomonadales bacterium]